MKKNFLKIFFFIVMIMNLHAQENKSGLYVGENFQGEMDLYEALDWISINAQDGGEYSIVLKENLALSSTVLEYVDKYVTIFLKSVSTDTNIQLSYATRSPSSSLFTVKKGAILVLENGVELIGRSSASRPLVTISDGGYFVMKGGVIKGSKVDHHQSWYGGGVDVLSGGYFIMHNGEISGNSSYGGAGVNISKNAHFRMFGGIISKNYAYNVENRGVGGGVHVAGTFWLVDGQISDNSCHRSNSFGKGAGVYVSSGGSFKMDGGRINNNLDGGIFINDGHVTINGGSVDCNKGYYGGVYLQGDSSLIMTNGIISQNSSSEEGGAGVYINRDSSFTMYGGKVAENTTNGGNGGGVYVNGAFIMHDGTICGNKTSKSGGGVYVHFSGTFTKSNTAGIIYGGEATDGNANIADQYGHAVYTKNGSRDSTARTTMKLDSTKYGADGGWE